MIAAGVPETMRAVEIAAPGDAGALRLAERPVPRPGAGEVLIRVAAAGVNRPDLLQRQGLYPPPPGVTDIPGLEVAGHVAALGEDVREPRPGEAVCALVAGGGYAEYAVAPAAQCLPVPAGLSLVDAASLPETHFTVWTNVFERGRLRAGESLLVHGGASGIGVTCVQLARARGARVFVTVGTRGKGAACERLGAERAIHHPSEDFVAVARELAGGDGVDVILDMVGGDYTPRNLQALAVEGRLVQIAYQRGARVEIDWPTIMQRRLTLTGSTLRARPVAEKGRIAAELRREVWPLFESGAVKPVVFATFPLAAAADAHRLMESSAHVGKIVLRVQEQEAS
jgi:putative PIG3 family NAD(P)H quinone oxidoreductase